jgi:hypothetical protein
MSYDAQRDRLLEQQAALKSRNLARKDRSNRTPIDRGRSRSRNTESIQDWLSRIEMERYETTGVPSGFPPAFESFDGYLESLASLRSSLKDAETTGVERFVYVAMPIQPGDNPIKIGYSKHPQKRLRDMQVGSPQRLMLAGTRRCPSPNYDREIHKHLPVEARNNGEWYRATDWVVWVLHVLEIVPFVGGRPEIPKALVDFRDAREDWLTSAGDGLAQEEGSGEDA